MRFSSRAPWFELVAIPGIIVAASSAVYGTVYLTVEEAQQAVFPGEAFASVPLTLSNNQRIEIRKKAGTGVSRKNPKVWRTSHGGYFFVDEVLGKHELITYAVGINADGGVRKIEIMDYRETYGYQIRDEKWREQFIGKTLKPTLKLDSDIKNISGATLSCRHVTDGVKRVLAMYEISLKDQ